MLLDRLASPALMKSLTVGQWSWLPAAVRLQSWPGMLDLRFRSNTAAGTSQAVLYLGERAAFRLIEQGGAVTGAGPAQPLTAIGPEGRVQAAVCSSSDKVVLDRECAFRFSSTVEKVATLDKVAGHLIESAHALAAEKVGVFPAPPKFGQELDALAVAEDGRLEVIEIKCGDATGGITWGPAQVGVYAVLLCHWLRNDATARSVLERMLAQRVELGLAPPDVVLDMSAPIRAVVAIGEPVKSPVVREKAEEVQARMLADGVGWPEMDARLVRQDGSTESLGWFK